MRNISTRSLCLGVALAIPFSAFGQVGALSDTLATKLATGERVAKLNFRSFNENEASIYGNLSLYYGLSNSLDLVIRGSGAQFTTVGLSRTGGTDIEIQAIWRKNGVYVALGGAKPSTPAQDKPVATWTAGWQGTDEGRAAFAGVTGVTSKDVTLVAAAFALRTPLSERLSFDATSTFMIRGENTSNLVGVLEREPVFNFALRYVLDGGNTVWVSAGNSLGDTTGFSLSHRIQRGFGLGAGLQVKF